MALVDRNVDENASAVTSIQRDSMNSPTFANSKVPRPRLASDEGVLGSVARFDLQAHQQLGNPEVIGVGDANAP